MKKIDRKIKTKNNKPSRQLMFIVDSYTRKIVSRLEREFDFTIRRNQSRCSESNYIRLFYNDKFIMELSIRAHMPGEPKEGILYLHVGKYKTIEEIYGVIKSELMNEKLTEEEKFTCIKPRHVYGSVKKAESQNTKKQRLLSNLDTSMLTNRYMFVEKQDLFYRNNKNILLRLCDVENGINTENLSAQSRIPDFLFRYAYSELENENFVTKSQKIYCRYCHGYMTPNHYEKCPNCYNSLSGEIPTECYSLTPTT